MATNKPKDLKSIMSAPRAKFERIYIVSPIKVAIIFLTSLQCLFLLITLLTSFWVETKLARYGPLFSCQKQCIRENSQNASWTFQCSLGGFIYDRNLFRISLTAILIILSLLLSILSIVTGNFSFIKTSSSIRDRYWLCTILLLLFICLIDCFILVCIPLSYHHQIYQFQWAYGLHCSGTVFISVSLIVAILTHHTDDVRYIERIEK